MTGDSLRARTRGGEKCQRVFPGVIVTRRDRKRPTDEETRESVAYTGSLWFTQGVNGSCRESVVHIMGNAGYIEECKMINI